MKFIFNSLLVLIFLASNTNAWGKNTCYNVLDYGARNDNTPHSETGINAAIQAATKIGGGSVYIPAGNYTCGPIRLESNIELIIEAGATLYFPADHYQPIVKGRTQGVECLLSVPLIGGSNLENVTITGRGTVTTSNEEWMKLMPRAEGSAFGPYWNELLKSLEKKTPATEEEYLKAVPELRPPFIHFMECKNVIIEGIHLIGSSMWPIHILYSENVVVQNLTVNTFPGIHTGGIYLDSSTYVRISNCFVETGDDAIVIKSGKDADGLRVNRPTEHVTITNCTIRRAHGAVTIGSEISGGISNIVANNIVCLGTRIGVRIKSGRGRGGYIENVRYNNWTMEDVGQAINITSHYLYEGDASIDTVLSDRTPRFSDIAISNMTINNARVAINIDGLPELPIKGVHISDIIANGQTGMKAAYTDGLELHNVQVNAESGPAFIVQKSNNLELDGISTRFPQPKFPVVRLDHCLGSIIRGSKAVEGTGVFFSTGLGELKNTKLIGNALKQAQKETEEIDVDLWTGQEPATEPQQKNEQKLNYY